MTIELLAEKDALKKQIAELQLALDKANEKFCYIGYPEYLYNIDYDRDMIYAFAESIMHEHYNDLRKQILAIKEVIKHSDLHYFEGYVDALLAVEGMINKWEERYD